jgi:hypothetical protein
MAETSIPRRHVGRPPVVERMASVTTNLPPPYLDRIIQLAKKHDRTVAATVRQLLMLRLR